MNDIRVITLGGKHGEFSIVDVVDFPRIGQFKWHADKNGYARRTVLTNTGPMCVLMHRQILNAPKRLQVDHRNHCHFDNTRRNLRRAIIGHNQHNRVKQQSNTSSQFKGVSWDKKRSKWQAKICVDYHQISLGRFNQEVQAALAYNRAALKLHGQFSSLNTL